MRHEEEKLQMQCVRWFDYQYGRYGFLLHASPNGGKRNAREAARFKAMGTRAGFPDLFLAVGRHGFNGMFIEMKVGRNTETERQKHVRKQLEEAGYYCCVCRSFDAFRSEIDTYIQTL